MKKVFGITSLVLLSVLFIFGGTALTQKMHTQYGMEVDPNTQINVVVGATEAIMSRQKIANFYYQTLELS